MAKSTKKWLIIGTTLVFMIWGIIAFVGMVFRLKNSTSYEVSSRQINSNSSVVTVSRLISGREFG